MKIKYKMIGLFILSIFISVIVFLVTTYALLDKGYLAGVTPEIMKQITKEVADSINEKEGLSREEVKVVLQEANQKYDKVSFGVLLKSNEVIEAEASTGIDSIDKLIKGLSQNEQYGVHRWIASETVQVGEEEGYLITSVDQSYFKTITYHFNGPKARGVLGKIMILGLMMTIAISTLITYLFTRRIMYRMKLIDKAIDQFELGNLEVRIENQKPDELGKLAHSFNGMTKKIKEQVKIQEEYEEKRKQLISNISHDLRTPLASVVGYSELLLDEIEENTSHFKYIEIIHRKALYMEKLLNQLLEFSRLENGSLKVHLEKGDIVECVREILIEYIPSMDEQEIDLILELEEDPIIILYDQDKIERVIRNLIDNAFKYGMKKKKLRVAVYKEEREAIIEIEDFGVGMDNETLSHIFERFYRGNRGRETKSGGMGLGLSIALEIVRQHSGQLEITSSVNEGTKASIKLPLAVV